MLLQSECFRCPCVDRGEELCARVALSLALQEQLVLQEPLVPLELERFRLLLEELVALAFQHSRQ